MKQPRHATAHKHPVNARSLSLIPCHVMSAALSCFVTGAVAVHGSKQVWASIERIYQPRAPPPVPFLLYSIKHYHLKDTSKAKSDQSTQAQRTELTIKMSDYDQNAANDAGYAAGAVGT